MQDDKKIFHIKPHTFEIVWINLNNQRLRINFSKIINYFQLDQEPFLLVHFQAKPRTKREWGVYSFPEDSYTSTKGAFLSLPPLAPEVLDMPESFIASKTELYPTAVLYYPNCTFNKENNFIKCYPAS